MLNSAIIACAVVISPAVLAEESDCYKVSETVTKAVTAKPNNVLAIVERVIATNPACSCEIVKAAIVATEAERDLVAQIVGAAIEAAPDQFNIITNCAIAVAPDALPNIQAAVSKLHPKISLLSSKGGLAKGGLAKGGLGAKGGKDAGAGIRDPEAVRDPLDEIYLVPGLPPIHPPLVSSTCTPDEFPNIDILP